MSLFRRAELPAPPEPRWSKYALAVRLGWTIAQVDIELESFRCVLAPAGPWGEMCPAETDCISIVARRDQQVADEQRHEAEALARQEQFLSGGGVSTLVDRPGPERERVQRLAQELDAQRQAVKQGASRWADA